MGQWREEDHRRGASGRFAPKSTQVVPAASMPTPVTNSPDRSRARDQVAAVAAGFADQIPSGLTPRKAMAWVGDKVEAWAADHPDVVAAYENSTVSAMNGLRADAVFACAAA